MRRSVFFALGGAFLALGAPAGLVVLNCARARDFSWTFVQSNLASEWALYAYVGCSTVIAFACFGAYTGFQADALDRLARVDHLTSLLNRRAFEVIAPMEFARARRRGSALAALLIDVDGLKSINDRGGHRRGDDAIRAVAAAILSVSRATDICARWGGDEFAVLASDTDQSRCRALAERIRHEVESRDAGVTVSVGVVTWLAQPGADDPSSLFADADAALYRAKAEGRNRVVVGERRPPRPGRD